MPATTTATRAAPPAVAPEPERASAAFATPLAATAAALLQACGGGGGGGDVPAPAPEPQPPAPLPLPPKISAAEAARFLAQASLGASRAQIASVQVLGHAGWLDAQFALPPSGTRWDWLIGKGFDALSYKQSEAGFDAAAWRALISAPDTLRQRVTLALSEILVVSIGGLDNGGGWRAFSAAAHLDLLEAHAFGNLRALLGAVSQSVAMGLYLTFKGNTKANAANGSLPDENYARELMQLFTIGLVQLQDDGTPRLSNGQPLDSYGQDDIAGLARVFTGWDIDLPERNTDNPAYQRRPMRQIASRHESGAKSFLGTTIPAGTDGADSLRLALDAIFAHPNVGPFWSRQLIQRLVTSNPSPAYVARIAAVFANDGSGVRGNLRAMLRALLLDDEARGSAARALPGFGKLREPMLRLLGWARAFGLSSPSDAWALGNTTDPGTRLGQSPLRSPSVFNFFRPGYVPPNSGIASAGLVAPEFQITNESSVVGYLNFMQRLVAGGVGDLTPDYSGLMPLADTTPALLNELNTVLAGGALDSATLATMNSALDTMPAGSDAARRNRIHAALMLVLAAPDYLVLK